MSVVSAMMAKNVENGSMIRRMFELGNQLKAKYGAERVCDFSLGNPDLAPPKAVQTAMYDLAGTLDRPASLGYMSNGGFAWALDKLAAWLSVQQGIALTRADVMLSVGAAGAMNAFLHSVLEPGDEVLGVAPYFVEYGFYTGNHGGVFKAVNCRPGDFGLDLDALAAALNPKTRAVIINSPNNPTGTIYPEEDLRGLCALLEDASARFGRPVYLVSDEPYRFLAYDGAVVPAVLPLYKYAVLISSFSKNYGLAGERIGYVALSPAIEDKELLMNALTLSNRTLGYVNPPIVGQYLMAAALGTDTSPALEIYTRRRDMLADILTEAGASFVKPKGAFYFFPKAPGGNDAVLVDCLTEELVLAVPGAGFGYPGHIRLSFAVEDAVIERSREGFKRGYANAAEKLGL
ncbi:MAG: pyridoxal phosphate-dependent aminotransferase [Mailhella sp.]|nr:pyridoxal phosphate-dependent aminotransferase [Mailhella sp.]